MSGLPGIAGALSGLTQGFVAGRQLRDSEAEEQAKLKQQQIDNATSILPYYQQLARTDSIWARSPAAAAAVNKTLQPLGINLGNTLPDTFGNIDPAELLKDPSSITALRSLPTSVRQELKPGLGNALGPGYYDPNSPDGQPQIPPNEAIQMLTDLNRQLQPYENGTLDANDQYAVGIRQQIAYVSQFIPGFQSPTAPPAPNPTAPVHLGYKATNSNIHATNDTRRTDTTVAQSPHKIAEIDAQTGLAKAKTVAQDITNNVLPQIEAAKLSTDAANARYTNERADFLPQQVRNQTVQANAAAARADQGQQHLSMEITAFKQLGTTPAAMQAYSGIVTGVRNQADNERKAVAQIDSAMQAMVKNNFGELPKKGTPAGDLFAAYQTEREHRNKVFNTLTAAADKLARGQSSFAQAALHGQGAPASFRLNPKSPNAPKPPGGDPVANAIQALSAAGHTRKDAGALIDTANPPFTPQQKAKILAGLKP